MLTLTVDVQVGAEAKALLILARHVWSSLFSSLSGACSVASSLGDVSRNSGAVMATMTAIRAFLRTSDKI